MARRLTLLLGTTAAIVLMGAGTAAAGPVSVHDDSNVLDTGRVTTAGNALPDPVQVYTSTVDAGNNTAFDKRAQSHLSGPSDVVLAINTQSKHLVIRTGRNSHIRTTAEAGTAFQNAFGTGDYTGATVAALNNLTAQVQQAGPANQPLSLRHHSTYHHHSSGGFGWVALLCPILIVIAIVMGIASLFRRRGRGTRGGGYGPPPGGGYGPPPGGGYGPGGYGPPGGGYGPAGGGYGPGYEQPRGGMSAGMAGGLGAVGGGLLGYELGKMEERHEDRESYDAGYQQGFDQGSDDQQFGGGGGDYDFGGGGGGFDGGGYDNGGNSDF